MFFVVLILLILMIVFMVHCFKKESALTGTYKTYHVFGRFRAYITVSLMLAGIAMIVSGILVLLGGEEGAFLNFLIALVEGVVFGGIGVLLYKSAYARCPKKYQSRMLRDMITIAFGVALKIVLFFLPAVWAITGPRVIRAENGIEYVLDGLDVYNFNGELVGKFDPSNEKIRLFTDGT